MMHPSTRPVRLTLRRFPHLTYSPLSSVSVALLVVLRMHDELCIGNRETEYGGASSDPETALLRYVVTYSILIVRLYTSTRTTKDEGRALGGPPASVCKVQHSLTFTH